MEAISLENMNTTMMATVLRTGCRCLVVCDHFNSQEVIVHTDEAHCFSQGDCVCIQYNGAMTRSMPPQINALSICCAGSGRG